MEVTNGEYSSVCDKLTCTLRVSFNGRTRVSHTLDTGSIPVTRSIGTVARRWIETVSNRQKCRWNRRERSLFCNCLDHRSASGRCFPTSPVEDHRHRRHGGTSMVPPLSMTDTVSGFARPFLIPVQTIQNDPPLSRCRFQWIVKTVRNELGPENPDHIRVPGV